MLTAPISQRHLCLCRSRSVASRGAAPRPSSRGWTTLTCGCARPSTTPPTQPFPPVPLQTARFRYSTLTVPVALALAVVARRRRRLLAAAVARLHRCSPPLLAVSVAAFPSVPARLSISLVHLRCCGCRYARNRPQPSPSPSLSHSLALALAVAIEQGVTFISSRTLCECPGGRGRPAAPVCSRRGAGEI